MVILRKQKEKQMIKYRDIAEEDCWDDRVVFMQGLIPFIPFALGSFNLTILLSLAVAVIYIFFIFEDDGDVWTERELKHKKDSFKGIMIMVWIPIYIFYGLYLFA